ncbi:hypothetical protein ACFQX7_23875 [Luedemannella flava]
MLDGLDAVHWAGLKHAHGDATDVPGQLRDLRSLDPEARRQARWALHSNIFHQGLRFEATAPAVPFLLELLADPATPERAELIDLLVTIAIGYSELWLPDGLSIQELSPGPARAAYDEVRKGLPLFRALAAESDEALRTAAAYSLAWFPDDAAGSVPVLAEVAAVSRAEGEGPRRPRWWRSGCSGWRRTATRSATRGRWCGSARRSRPCASRGTTSAGTRSRSCSCGAAR